MDKPLCDMGFPGFLCVFQLLLGRSNMVRIQLRIKKTNLIVVILVGLFILVKHVSPPDSINWSVISPPGLSWDSNGYTLCLPTCWARCQPGWSSSCSSCSAYCQKSSTWCSASPAALTLDRYNSLSLSPSLFLSLPSLCSFFSNYYFC